MPAASPTTAAPRVSTVPQDKVIATTSEAAPKVVGVVKRSELEQPTAGSPDPVRYHGIHGDRPQDENHPGRELGAVRDRTAGQCGGDDREPQLEGGEQQFGDPPVGRVRVDAEHPDVGEVANQSAKPVLGEREGVADHSHATVINGIEMKLIMIMLSTPVVRTMPP